MADCGLCDHFEELQYFLIYDFDNPSGIREDMKVPPNTEIRKIPDWLIEHGVTDIIARGIDYVSIRSLNQKKIHVFVGVEKKHPECVIDRSGELMSASTHGAGWTILKLISHGNGLH